MKFFDEIESGDKIFIVFWLAMALVFTSHIFCVTAYNVTELVLEHQCSTIKVEKQ